MKKSIAILLLMVVTIFSGCTQEGESSSSNDSGVVANENLQVENPFDDENNSTVIMGSLSHGHKDKEFDEDNNLIPFRFDGNEIQFNYSVTASETAKNVGFLLFVDGIAQPYKVNNSEENSYLTSITLKEDDLEESFQFSFIPITGKKGDLLSLTIVSVYNSDFKPDMIETTSYGMYHNILPATYQILFNEDAPITSINNDYVLDVVQTQQAITEDFINTKLSSALMDITTEMLNENVYSLIYYDDKEILSGHLEYSDTPINVDYIITGVTGAKYKTTFYLNHQAISDSYNTTLEQGKSAILNFNIDINMLSTADTFYAISIPINAKDYMNAHVMVQKTPSFLFYKEN